MANIKKKRTLAECEAVIQDGMETFLNVGNALLEIKEEGLYLECCESFKEYIEVKWKKSVSWAYKLIQKEVTAKPNSDTKGGQTWKNSTSADTEALKSEGMSAGEVNAEQRDEWEDDGRPIKEEKDYAGERQERTGQTPPKSHPLAAPIPTDSKGTEIPDRLKDHFGKDLAIWAKCEKEMLSAGHALRELEQTQSYKDAVAQGDDRMRYSTMMISQKVWLRDSKPGSVCPKCKGEKESEDAEPCRRCGGIGWLSAAE